jgi:general stress protein YciG
MADTSQRGFASMDDDKQREIASKGGQAAIGVKLRKIESCQEGKTQ